MAISQTICCVENSYEYPWVDARFLPTWGRTEWLFLLRELSAMSSVCARFNNLQFLSVLHSLRAFVT
jgi:hypothetical protein